MISPGILGVVASRRRGGGTAPFATGTVLQCHFEGADLSTTFTDSVGGKTITRVGSPVISTTQAKIGSASGKFLVATSDALSLARSSDFDFGSGDSDVDMWVYPTTLSGVQGLFYNTKANARGFVLATSGSSLAALGYDNAGGLVYNITSGVGVMVANVWQHVAVTRSGSSIRLFAAGSVVGTATAGGSGVIEPNTNGFVSIGEDPVNAGRTWPGYIDELRVVKGNAVWTSAFTPYTDPYADS